MTDEKVVPRFEGNSLVIETGGETETYDSQFLVAALLVYVAQGDGTISVSETDAMLGLVENQFQLRSAESLALLTRAMTQLAENPDLESLLRDLSIGLSPQDKEDIAVMLLKVIASDGTKDVEEIEKLNAVAKIVDISPELMHKAYDRYFDEAQ